MFGGKWCGNVQGNPFRRSREGFLSRGIDKRWNRADEVVRSAPKSSGGEQGGESCFAIPCFLVLMRLILATYKLFE